MIGFNNELAYPSQSVSRTNVLGKLLTVSVNGLNKAMIKNGNQQMVKALIITPKVIEAFRSLITELVFDEIEFLSITGPLSAFKWLLSDNVIMADREPLPLFTLVVGSKRATLLLLIVFVARCSASTTFFAAV